MPVRIENMTEPIPGYRLLERLGRGGFGEVWKVEAPGGLHKAIKFVYGDLSSPRDGVAAEQELKALSRVKSVRHPFILSLERVDIIDGQLIIVSELADRNLYERFVECRSHGLIGIPRDELLPYMAEAAEALDLMNTEHQLQHLDIKPQNLFLVHNHVKVGDFGLVKDMEGMKASVTGGVTPLYAAPETFEGWVSRYSDQYSLAIVYQELLTGQRPFPGTNARQLVLQHLTAAPDLAPLPPGDRAAIARALSKTPDDRYPSCRELIRALKASGTSEPVPVARAQPSQPSRQDTDSDWQTDERRASPAPCSEAEAALVRSPPRPVHVLSPVPRSPLSDTSANTHLCVPPEIRGDGVLLPALIIGVGEQGLGVLRRLRQALYTRFGSLDAVPHLRLLYLDTDPEGIRKAVEGEPGPSLIAPETLLTRLNRPSHYLKSGEGLSAVVQPWFDPQMLFRIPRSQATTGLRALGRLAFFDNYRKIASRIQSEFEACTHPDALAAADRHIQLGVRSNRPRVYVVAGLAGGTGGGMFLDLAYVARWLLKQMGYAHPEVVGLLLLPAVDRHPSRTVALGNAYAALTELNHFSAPEVTFTARYDSKEEPVCDPAPPFVRCTLLPLDAGPEGAAKTASLGAGFLFHDLFTPLGRAADTRRGKCLSARSFSGQGIGLYRLSWPRRSLVRRLARKLCSRLVQRWIAKDAERLRQAIRSWVAEQWTKRELEVDHLLGHLEAACEKVLGGKPESALARIVQPLTGDEAGAADLDPDSLAQVVAQIEKLLGRPDDDSKRLQSAVMVDTLDAAVRALSVRSERKLAKVAVCLVEQPEYRLAGAEEAIRQISEKLQQSIDEQAALSARVASQAAVSQERLRSFLDRRHGGAGGKRKAATLSAAELVELLSVYPRMRYQSLLLQRVVSVYRGLLGNCPEYQREFGFCRARLGDLLRLLEGSPLTDPAEINLGPGRWLLPPGCGTLDDVAEKFLRQVTPASMLDFEDQVQEMIRRQFKALVHVCMASGNLLTDLLLAMQEKAESFADAQLGTTTVAAIFREQYADAEAAAAALVEGFTEAQPGLSASPGSVPDEFRVLVTPRQTTAEGLCALAGQVIPAASVVSTLSLDDIVFYREQVGLKLADLPQLSSQAREAYTQMAAVEHFTPHSRMDVLAWLPVTR